ncbi:hypothetical protein M8C21_008812 [Ambrosia artemisiifolia]|uniref:digalactosyldiacylglycerol synthase n=1 Tax=Ambrosia artemisiifolia TaxID=4212 RepID=A0AAD5GB16_AMBAR|nr:hypothetical protein M8C21_008812 [Ambrosia artemisiifolia]
MINFRPPESDELPSTVITPSTVVTALISKGWRGVKDSTKADIRLMKDRAESFKNLASSFDREREGFREMESNNKKKKRSSLQVFEGFRNTQFVMKIKSRLKSLDVPELLSYLVRQSGPLLDQLGVKKDVSNKIIESLCNKRKSQLQLTPIYACESFNPENDTIVDDLDSRVASVLHSTGHHVNHHEVTDEKRHVAIVTTASLPWMTGTAVNPLFRAAYLAKSRKQSITLLVPWLTRSDQELVYPNNITFSSPEEQEVYIRSWLEERVGFKTDFKISFYPGKREKNGALQAFFVKHINNLVTRAYCDKVLRLSAATQDLPKSVICNVHGVNPKFLKIGEKTAAERENGRQSFSKGAYFLGKMVWAKGYRELIDLLAKQKDNLDYAFKIDVYGNGEDANEVQSAAKKLNLNMSFMKGIDHADDSLHSYKVFINPSVSDVLCTATAEALAMGKFVVCADHPSNDFFRSFPNCLSYNSPQDFVEKVKLAMESEPHPLTPDQRFSLSWEAATERFMQSSELDKILTQTSRLTRTSNSVASLIDGTLAFAHYCFTGNEFFRLCTGAVPGTRDYDKQHSSDLHLLPPDVENPIYGW